MKKFDIPTFYKSSITGRIKELRREIDPRKKDFTPTTIDFGPVRFHVARHFGFCYGVENAIEISFKAIEENPDKRIFLLSQMIHNQQVNHDLQERGVKFIMDTGGKQLISWDEITHEDIVIVPAFGTTLEIAAILEEKGVEIQKYNTTCPFVERVWKKSDKLGASEHTIVIHGKPNHEETRATFSHSKSSGASIVVKDIHETKLLGKIITGELPIADFYTLFEGRYSEGFDPTTDLNKVGVVNQTTMLASDTQEIADYLKQIMLDKFGAENAKAHFSDTRDTLCYATNDNQQATYGLLELEADLALVVGGYNSSNTSHIVELCERKFPTYFISSAEEIKSKTEIHHFDYPNKKPCTTANPFQGNTPLDVVLTSGASCPDTLVDQVMEKVVSFFEGAKSIEAVMEGLENQFSSTT